MSSENLITIALSDADMVVFKALAGHDKSLSLEILVSQFAEYGLIAAMYEDVSIRIPRWMQEEVKRAVHEARPELEKIAWENIKKDVVKQVLKRLNDA